PGGQAHVIAASEPLDPGVSAGTYATIQGDLLRKEFPGFREEEFRSFPFLGASGFLRVFSWHPPDGVPVSQMQVYWAENGRGYTATATTPSSLFRDHQQIFEAMLGGLRLERSTGSTAPLAGPPPPSDSARKKDEGASDGW